MDKIDFYSIVDRAFDKDTRPTWLAKMVNRPNSFYYYRAFVNLTRYMQPELVVELGTNKGVGALHFKHGCPEAKVITVDINLSANAKLLASQDILHPVSDSVDYAKLVDDVSVDILFIDTNSWAVEDSQVSYGRVTEEIEAWFPKMKPGGIILFDDIRLNDGMFQAWDELIGCKVKELHPCVSFGVLFI